MSRKVYDSAFRTLAAKMPELLVPLLAEAHGREFPPGEMPWARAERVPAGGSYVEADGVLELCGSTYHVECQSRNDPDMARRMLEYAIYIALAELPACGHASASRRRRRAVLALPSSCVVYLAQAPSSLECAIRLPNGDSLGFEPRIVRAREYSMDDMFAKGLLILYPFYLLRYERKLGAIERDPARRRKLLDECAQLAEGLACATEGMPAAVYNNVTSVASEVAAHLFREHAGLGEEARKIMGGEIWELWSEKVERELREATEESLEQGLEQGLEQASERNLRALMANAGCNADEAMRLLSIPESERPRYAELLAAI